MKFNFFLLFILSSVFSVTAFTCSAFFPPPTLRISAPYYSEDCRILYKFTFTASDNTMITSLDIDFGDGNVSNVSNINSLVYITEHSYTTSGTYYVAVSGSSGPYSYNLLDTVIVDIPNNNSGAAGFTVTNVNFDYSFIYTGTTFSGHNYILDFGDGTPPFTGTSLANSQVITTHSYSQPGSYGATLTHIFTSPSTGVSCELSYQDKIEIENNIDNTACCSNFSPDLGKEYWLSAWVQEDVGSPVLSYSNKVYIELEFERNSSSNAYARIYPSEDIIEGWQRIVGSFIVPQGTHTIQIHMINENPSMEAFFDDIRIHPFNGSMKSYVYDPVTLLLTAELDDNNYATFYEYDKEGQLIRIKKETARGIMTIQESRSSNHKIAVE